MQKNYRNLIKKIAINTLVVTLAIGGLTNELCEGSTVTPGADKYCPIEIINYQANSKGDIKPSEIIWGNVKSDSNGNCPDPKISNLVTPE